MEPMASGKHDESIASGNGRGHTIATKVIDAGVNEKQTWAHIAGWIGQEDHPHNWVEDWITIVFQFELDRRRAEGAQEGCPCEIIWHSDGTPEIRLLEPRDEQEVSAKLAELKRVGPAAVVEEATTRVICRLLGIEWRSREEIELERDHPDWFG